MGFTEAVRSVLMKYVTFEGRARRSEYWWWVLFLVIVYAVTVALDAALGSAAFTAVAALALFLPTLAVGARRLHDVGMSGWWLLLDLVPFGALVLLVFALQDSRPGTNRFGPSPKDPPAVTSSWGA